MKALIVALYHYNGQGLDSWIDHGAGMTYTAAKLADCDVSFLDMKSLNNNSELEESLKGYDLISFGLKSSYYSLGMKVIKFAKAQGSKVMVGGYHATAAPNELIENSDIDYIFHGESELTFPKFLKNPELFDREIFGEKPQNLDDLPIMDRSMYREPLENCLNWWYGGVYSKMTTVMAARGCPYKCAFCQPLEDNHFGKKLRRRSPRNLIDELAILKRIYNPECVMIHDDTFFIDMKWLEEFAEQYYSHIRLPFWASARSDGICEHPDMVKKLVKVGWELISVGFESGSQRILNKLKKGTTVEQNLEAARIIKSTGAKIYANYITAIPWETKWDIQATAKMADEIAAEMPSWAYFTPYPGCELGEECIKKGWSLLNRSTYDRCPSGEKVKYVDYAYISDVRKGFREEVYPEFCDIIIPSYKNEQFTMNCLNSIKECTKPGTYRVIWVDNGSESSSAVDEVISQMDHLTIKLPTNEGFVGAINKGLEASDAPNVCLLNNDTVVSPRWLEKLISALAKYPKLGIVGALTNYGRGSAVDSHHSLSLHSSLLPKGSDTWDLAKINQHLEMGYLGRTHPITFVAFLCAIIKREVINKVGHLDPNFAMGMWDDLDYNRSVQAFGYKTELAIDTCIQHFGRSTFNLVQLKEKFDVNALLKVNKAYLDKKWEGKKFITKLPTAHDTIIISRAIYESMGSSSEIGILTEHRLSLMQRYFINSLKNQTDQDFAIHLIVGPENNETTKRIKKLNWEDLNINFIYSNEDLSQWKLSVAGSKNFGREIDNGCPEWIVKNSNHPRTSIMARLDTDDWIAPGWIAHMKYLTRTTPLSHFLINYQIIGQWTDGRLYNFNAAHTKARTSPFIVLVQKTDPRISPYEDLHLHMGGKFSLVLTIPPGYAFMVVHGENRSNRFYKNDTYIGGTDLVGYNPKVIPIASMEKGQVYIDNTVPGTDWRARIARVKVR